MRSPEDAGPTGPRAPMPTARASLLPADRFVTRHIGPSPDETQAMLHALGYDSAEQFLDAVVPEDIRLRRPLALPPGRTEREVLQALRGLAAQNQLFRSYIGMGYHHSFTPQVIQRNIVENPGWYTAYTPYQPEIAQGRLEALLNFQTMVADLTALPIANASLLDEATAAAEAMHLTEAVADVPAGTTPMFMITDGCHPQTIAVVRTRAEARGVQTVIADPASFEFRPGVIGALLQYPTTHGKIEDYRAFCDKAHAAGALVTVATDLLALTLLAPPGEWGAAIAVGNSQRFGVRMGYGGPHAAFFATRETERRHGPGRLSGVSRAPAAPPARRGPGAPHQPADHLPHAHRRVARRGHDARRSRGSRHGVLAQRSTPLHGRRSRRDRRPLDPRIAPPHLVLPHPSGVPPLPVRDGNAALYQAARGTRPVAHVGDDPARLVHHEAQRHHRDGPTVVARVQPAAPVRPARAGHRLPPAAPPARGHAGRDHRLPEDLVAAELRGAGRVHRTAGDPGLSPLPSS